MRVGGICVIVLRSNLMTDDVKKSRRRTSEGGCNLNYIKYSKTLAVPNHTCIYNMIHLFVFAIVVISLTPK